DLDAEAFDPDSDLLALIEGMTLLSLVGIVDPPRPTAKAAIETAKMAGIRVRMITGDHAVTAAAIAETLGIDGRAITGAEAADMILTDDNFATIVKAVELGRGLYDNLTKYIRFQMGVLAGMVLAFLGASIFNIVAGVIFLPLQTLWVNFTTQVLQSVGLGYG